MTPLATRIWRTSCWTAEHGRAPQSTCGVAIEIDPADADNHNSLAIISGEARQSRGGHRVSAPCGGTQARETPQPQTTLPLPLRSKGDSTKRLNVSKQRCASIPISPKLMRGWRGCWPRRRSQKRRCATIKRRSGFSRRSKTPRPLETGSSEARHGSKGMGSSSMRTVTSQPVITLTLICHLHEPGSAYEHDRRRVERPRPGAGPQRNVAPLTDTFGFGLFSAAHFSCARST